MLQRRLQWYAFHVLLVATLGSAAGCTNTTPSDETSTSRSAEGSATRQSPKEAPTPSNGAILWMEGEDPVIIVHDSPEAYLVATSLTLRYDTGSKCLRFQTSSNALPGVPIWRKGVKPVTSNGKHGVDVPDVGRIEEGDTFTVVGGFDSWGTRPPDRFNLIGAEKCLEDVPEGTVFYINKVEMVNRPNQ